MKTILTFLSGMWTAMLCVALYNHRGESLSIALAVGGFLLIWAWIIENT